MVKPTVTLSLRTRQANYLAQIAARKDVSLSRAFAQVIERYRVPPSAASVLAAPPRIARTHFVMDPDHLALIDALALAWGLSRTDVARRIIDEVHETERLNVASGAPLGSLDPAPLAASG